MPAFNNETSRTDEAGVTTRFIYEDADEWDFWDDDDPFLGRVFKEREGNTTAGGATETLETRYAYNSYGQLTSKTLPKGNTGATPDPAYTTTYTYYGASESATDSCTGTSYAQRGLLKSISQPGLATITHVSDGAGNPVASTQGKGTTCAAYDALGRPTSMKAPDRSAATTFAYDADGRPTSINDPTLPAPTTYAYDDLGRPTSTKDSMAGAAEPAVTYGYDEHGNATTRSDKIGTVSYTVDELDRTTAITDAWGRTYSFAYDADGRLTKRTLPGGAATELGYDVAGNQTSHRHRYSDGWVRENFASTYDARGKRLTEAGDGWPDVGPDDLWVYRYDSIGRLEQVHDPITQRTRRYVFDLNSNRTQVQNNAGWSHTLDESIAWNSIPAGVNKSVTDNWKGDDASFAHTLPFSFPFFGSSYTQVYVSTNGFIRLGASGGTTKVLDVAKTSYRAIAPYPDDLVVDPSSLLNPGQGIYLDQPADNSYVRIRWQARTADSQSCANFEATLYPSGEVVFTYGCTSANLRAGVTAGTGVDFAARCTHCVWGSSRFQPAAAQTLRSYTYSALDRLTGGTGLSGITYNSDGEQSAITGPSPRGAWTYAYDGRGLMKSATSGGTTINWSLDGAGRVAKQTRGSAETRYRFAGPGDAPAWVENASGQVTGSYLSGPGGLLASYDAQGDPTFPLDNGHGDVVYLTDLAEETKAVNTYDEDGQATYYHYDADWNLVPGAADDRYDYTGRFQRERNADTGLVRMGARMYDPLTARFTSTDPVEAGDRNGYLYAGADPINNYDLNGEVCWSCAFKKLVRGVGSFFRQIWKGIGKFFKALRRLGKWLDKKIGYTRRIREAYGRRGWAGALLYVLWIGSVVATCGILTAGSPLAVGACWAGGNWFWDRKILRSREFRRWR